MNPFKYGEDYQTTEGQVMLSSGTISITADNTMGLIYNDNSKTININMDILKTTQFVTKGAGPVDPLILDMDGLGINLLDMTTSSHAYFDLTGNNFAALSGWTSGIGDGFLTVDANANGVIDGISELFGSATQTGFDELALLDSNADGKITSADTAWNTLSVWTDANSDGLTNAGELQTLDQAGITAVSLAATTTSQMINGNEIIETSTFTINGVDQTVGEALFATEPTNTYYNGALPSMSIEALTLPFLRGYGEMADTPVAMSLDAYITRTSNDNFEQVWSAKPARNPLRVA